MVLPEFLTCSIKGHEIINQILQLASVLFLGKCDDLGQYVMCHIFLIPNSLNPLFDAVFSYFTQCSNSISVLMPTKRLQIL